MVRLMSDACSCSVRLVFATALACKCPTILTDETKPLTNPMAVFPINAIPKYEQ